MSALVTGSSTGIGRATATALRLDAAGWRVFAGVRREEDAESLRDGLAYGVILQAVEIATAVALGLPALVREGLAWSDLRVQALSTAPVRLKPQPVPR